eukprot:1432156-Ditylum_brightwellii.AAC.1
MQIIHDVFSTASDDDFVKHFSTIKTCHHLGLSPSMDVEIYFNNIEENYSSKLKSNEWAKAVDEGQASIFVSAVQQYEQCDCWNCDQNRGTMRSHISRDCHHE